MLQRRIHRTAPRTRSLALGGALAALAVVGGGTVVAVNAPTDVAAGDILLAQNATDQGAAPQQLTLGQPVDVDLEPVVARAAGGTIPPGTTVQVTGLPDGLTQDGWVISGTPTRAGEYEVLVTVSNSGVSKSQKVDLAVVEGDATTTSPSTPDAEAQGDEGQGAEETGADGQDPTMSAVPGDPEQAGDDTGTDAGDDTGTDAEDGTDVGTGTDDDDNTDGVTSPDLCAALGEGELDGDSLTQLLPLVTGEGEEASSPLTSVLLNAVAGLLPSVLGESGSMSDLGSAGQVLCTLSPSLLGGGADTEGADDMEGAGDPTDDSTGGTEVTGGAPSALLDLIAGGGGSLGE